MPGGDAIHAAARRVGAALVGQPIESIEAPRPRHAMDRWPERLAGRGVRAVDARGKHLFVRFDGELTLHSHLRMGGWWGVFRRGERWRRSARRAWLILRTREHDVVQFDGPVLELMTEGRTRFDRRLAALGPDVLAEELDDGEFLRRLRADDPTRGVGEALLDQRVVSGIGTVWKSEGCFLAGLSPWRRTGQIADDEVLRVIHEIRPLMARSVDGDWKQPHWVFDRAGLPCRRCSTPIEFRGQGDDNRNTFWCPRWQ